MTRILCYGDSNTWGYTPGTGVRFDEHTRWTGRLQDLLGDQFQVVECGMNARTTAFSDPFRGFVNGCEGLGYCLLETKPLDYTVISLGTNDLKYGDALHSARGLDALLEKVTNANIHYPGTTPIYATPPRILVVSPIHLHPMLDEKFPASSLFGKEAQSHRFAALFREVARKYNADFLDASLYAQPSETDCVHMDPPSHKALAEAVAETIKKAFA